MPPLPTVPHEFILIWVAAWVFLLPVVQNAFLFLLYLTMYLHLVLNKWNKALFEVQKAIFFFSKGKHGVWHVGSALGLNLSWNAEMSFVCVFYNYIISTFKVYFTIF